MVKYIIILMVLWLILSICFSYMTYLIGYTKGLNKCKRINNEILDEHSKENRKFDTRRNKVYWGLGGYIYD